MKKVYFIFIIIFVVILILLGYITGLDSLVIYKGEKLLATVSPLNCGWYTDDDWQDRHQIAKNNECFYRAFKDCKHKNLIIERYWFETTQKEYLEVVSDNRCVIVIRKSSYTFRLPPSRTDTVEVCENVRLDDDVFHSVILEACTAE